MKLINQRIQEVLDVHQEKANTLADTIRQTAAELFAIPSVPREAKERIVTHNKPYWVTENWSTSMSPVPRGFFERFLPRNTAIRRIKRWLKQDIESIVLRNVGNLQFEMHQNIDDTFGRFTLDLNEQLEEIRQATLGAIQETLSRRKEKGEDINAELRRLASFESRLTELQSDLASVRTVGEISR